METKELIDVINEAAFQVRKALDAGYLESVYQNALIYELKSRGIHAEKECPLKVYYKDAIVGSFSVDILVERKIILEIKAVSEIHPIHEAQLVNYLTATKIDTGILINYGGEKFAFRVKDRHYSSDTKRR